MTTTEITLPGSALGLAAVTIDDLRQFTEQWLVNRRFKDNTRISWRKGVNDWLDYAEHNGIAPLVAEFTHINAYRSALEVRVDDRTGKTFAVSTVALKLTSISSWYRFLVKLGVITINPVDLADRPEVDQQFSTTEGLTGPEAVRLLRAAPKHSKRATAIVSVLLGLGIRVSELVGLELAQLTYNASTGKYSIKFTGKGGVEHYRTMGLTASSALSGYLSERAIKAGCRIDDLTGFVFPTASGKAIDRNDITDIIRSVAKKAKLTCAKRITPHWLRHTYVTLALAAGVPDTLVQASLRHRALATTQRYNRQFWVQENDPSLALDAVFQVGADANDKDLWWTREPVDALDGGGEIDILQVLAGVR